jgi:hypothetical protein
LSKNLLGYRDVVNTEHTGAAGGPIEISARPNLAQLSDEELRQLRAIAAKTLPHEIDRELAARRLREFVRQAWWVVEPSTPFVPGWHIDAIIEHLEAITAGPDPESTDQGPTAAHEEPAGRGAVACVGVDSMARAPMAL